MADFGLFGATIPTDYGGLGLDVSTYARVIEELSRGWMSLAGVVNSHLIAAQLIARFGTEEQRRQWLAADGSAERRGCFLAVGARLGKRCRGAAVSRPTATATSGSSTAPRCG